MTTTTIFDKNRVMQTTRTRTKATEIEKEKREVENSFTMNKFYGGILGAIFAIIIGTAVIYTSIKASDITSYNSLGTGSNDTAILIIVGVIVATLAAAFLFLSMAAANKNPARQIKLKTEDAVDDLLWNKTFLAAWDLMDKGTNYSLDGLHLVLESNVNHFRELIDDDDFYTNTVEWDGDFELGILDNKDASDSYFSIFVNDMIDEKAIEKILVDGDVRYVRVEAFGS